MCRAMPWRPLPSRFHCAPKTIEFRSLSFKPAQKSGNVTGIVEQKPRCRVKGRLKRGEQKREECLQSLAMGDPNGKLYRPGILTIELGFQSVRNDGEVLVVEAFQEHRSGQGIVVPYPIGLLIDENDPPGWIHVTSIYG